MGLEKTDKWQQCSAVNPMIGVQCRLAEGHTEPHHEAEALGVIAEWRSR